MNMNTETITFEAARDGGLKSSARGKVTLLARNTSMRVEAGDEWECRIETRDRVRIAYPLRRVSTKSERDAASRANAFAREARQMGGFTEAEYHDKVRQIVQSNLPEAQVELRYGKLVARQGNAVWAVKLPRFYEEQVPPENKAALFVENFRNQIRFAQLEAAPEYQAREARKAAERAAKFASAKALLAKIPREFVRDDVKYVVSCSGVSTFGEPYADIVSAEFHDFSLAAQAAFESYKRLPVHPRFRAWVEEGEEPLVAREFSRGYDGGSYRRLVVRGAKEVRLRREEIQRLLLSARQDKDA